MDIQTNKKTDITRQFEGCGKSLQKSALIINTVLHTKIHSLTYKQTMIDINSESKNTRRNSQYKTATLCMLYYIVYKCYYGVAPENIDFTSTETNKNTNNIYIKTVGKVKKYGPIQHYNTFRNYTYTYRLAQVIDECMSDMVDFGIQEYIKHCGDFIAINWTIKKKEKLKTQSKRKYSSKKRSYSEFASDDYCDDFNSINSACSTDDELDYCDELNPSNEILDKFKFMKLNELKEKMKEPSVLMKFYSAWLLECDWEVLLVTLQKKIETGYPHAQITKLLQYVIIIMCKIIHTPHERIGHIESLDSLLKNDSHIQVIGFLLTWARSYKYFEYSLCTYNMEDNRRSHDIKNFKEFARNTKNIYYHISPIPLLLVFSNYESTINGISISYTVLEYTYHNSKHLFDLIYSTSISRSILNGLSWRERLNLLKQISNFSDHSIIDIYPITLRDIQFDHAPAGSAVVYYIKPSGLGLGTLFIRLSDKQNADKLNDDSTKISNNRSNIKSTNKRFRRVNPSDLIESSSQPKIKKENVTASPPQQAIGYQSPSNNTNNNMLMNNIFSTSIQANPLISNFLQCINNIPSYYMHQNISSASTANTAPIHQESYQNLIQQQLTPLPSSSPIPSPPHTSSSGGLFLGGNDNTHSIFNILEEDIEETATTSAITSDTRDFF